MAVFYEQLQAALGVCGIEPAIRHPAPFDLADRTPFAEDTAHAS